MIHTARFIVPLAVLAACVIGTRPAAAQTSRPGVDCSLLTASQAAGLVCGNPPGMIDSGPIAVFPPSPIDSDCQNLNPYEQGEKAAECARRPLPGDATPTFLIAHVYAYGYSSQKARVLGISQDTAGGQVVTFEWLPESLNEGVIAMRTPAAPGGRSNWTYVGKPEPR